MGARLSLPLYFFDKFRPERLYFTYIYAIIFNSIIFN